jgi:hypothetical protein
MNAVDTDAELVATGLSNEQCETWIDDRRCVNAVTQRSLSRCGCGHLTGGDCCDYCAAVLREMRRLGDSMCLRCQNDGRNPHPCVIRSA